MATQESHTRADGNKIILRQSNEGRWSVKCMAPPAPDADTKQWTVLWDLSAWDVDGEEVPFLEEDARKMYERYSG